MKDIVPGSLPYLEIPADSDAGLFALVQSVSHDLRGTFGVMSGLHSLLPLISDENEKSEMFNRLHNNTEYATQLFGDLEAYCAIAAGQVGLEQVPFSPGAALFQMKKKMASMLTRRKITLQIFGSRDAEVIGDEDKFERIARNILFHLIHIKQIKDIALHCEMDAVHWYMNATYHGPSLPEWLVLPDIDGEEKANRPIGLMLVCKLVSLLGGLMIYKEDATSGDKVISVQFPH